MSELRIDAQMFRDMVISAANYLEKNKQNLNDLNVFPVPDGDTGTNMMMTLISAAKEVNACQTQDVGKMVQAFGDGALKGARGNSGVILSQLFRGFSKSVPKEQKTLDAQDFARAIEMGVEAAYKAVMKPKEGTILTVAKSMAKEARKQADAGAELLERIEAVIGAGEKMLQKTPELLPVLKEAGVVDAGGAGLIVIYKGFKMAMDGEEITTVLDLSLPKQIPASAMQDISTAEIEFGYCTEFFITHTKDVTEETIEHLRDKLLAIGDSLVVVGDPELIKVHVHTNMPGKVLQYALKLGQLSKIKIDNMREQHQSLTGLSPVEEEKPQKQIAVVAVSAGDGLGAIFKDCLVDELVEGGQSMNPSAEDIKEAIERAPSDHVIVLPNNKNIILAAEQAGELTEKTIAVIPSKTFPQGLSAMLSYRGEDASLEENEQAMREALGSVKSASVTKAVRDSHMNGEQILEGEFLGILEGDIVSHGTDMKQTVEALLEKMVTEDDAVISFYSGAEVAEEEARALVDEVAEKYDDLDTELYQGGQPVYHYIISVE